MTEDQNKNIQNISQSLESINKTLQAILEFMEKREAAFKERKREGFGGDRKPPFRKSFDRDSGGERGGYRKREEGGGGYRGREEGGGYRGRSDRDDGPPRRSFSGSKKPYERTKRTSDAPRKRYNSEE